MKKTEHPAYVIVSAEGQAEITEKKSRFIGQVFPVHNQTEAEERARTNKPEEKGNFIFFSHNFLPVIKLQA